jgi:TonB family protein
MGEGDVVAPVPLRESWAEMSDVFAVRVGIVEVVIDENGVVVAATMRARVNAVYDRLAIATAKKWRYKPATAGGVPVKFRKLVVLDPKTAR